MGKNSDNARFAKSRGGGGAMRKVMALVLTAALVMSSGISSAFAAGDMQPRDTGTDSGVLIGIKITRAPDKIAYEAGEVFIAKGMEVTATYTYLDSGVTTQDTGKTWTKVVTEYGYAPTDALKTTDTTVTVRYIEGGVTEKASQSITVTAAPTDTKALTEAITAATANKATATVSADGKDIAKDKKWVTEAVMSAYEKAIEDAQAIVDKKPAATTDEIAAGVKTLNMATTTFNTAKKDGSKEEIAIPADKAKLNAAINAANKAKTGIDVDDRAVSSVGKGVKFVTTTEMNALTTVLKAAIAVNKNKDATTAEANTAADKLTAATTVFKAAIKTGTYTSGGSGSGGSGSGGGGTTPPPASQDRPSDNVGTDGKVDKTETVKEVTNAVADAVKNTTDKTADVTIKNAEAITPDALKEIAAAATKAGGAVVLQADTVVDGKIEARLYIDPKLAANIKADIKLGVSLSESSTAATKEKFKNFDNKMAVASFSQQGSFGMKVPVAIKADLTGLNTKTLVFYSYDKATNKYIPIANTGYYIDKNGFLHFNTTVGGEIIITDKPLAKKK